MVAMVLSEILAAPLMRRVIHRFWRLCGPIAQGVRILNLLALVAIVLVFPAYNSTLGLLRETP